jgi:hypothetical protein
VIPVPTSNAHEYREQQTSDEVAVSVPKMLELVELLLFFKV